MIKPAKADKIIQYVTLGIDHEIFAVDVENVHEIIDICPISRVPNAPAYLAGMIDVRNKTVPVIDLRVKLGLSSIPPTQTTRIIVLDVMINGRTLILGLIADRVYEVTQLYDDGMEAPPDIGIRWHSQYIKGIGRRNDAFVIIIDLSHLFSDDGVALIKNSH